MSYDLAEFDSQVMPTREGMGLSQASAGGIALGIGLLAHTLGFMVASRIVAKKRIRFGQALVGGLITMAVGTATGVAAGAVARPMLTTGG